MLTSGAQSMATFNDVKTILDTIITNWTKGNGAPPDLLGAHQTAVFGWDTKDKLLKSFARGKQLIQPEVIGQKGKGGTANLVVALTVGVAPFPPMPFGGLDSNNGIFLAANSREITTIVQWIEAGCPP
jgi:hypothetical protein